MGNAMGDGRIDGVFGHVAAHAEIVVTLAVLRQRAALQLHLVRHLPGTQHHFAHTAHGLGVGGRHAEGTYIVQDVLGGNGFAADAAFGKGHVLGDGRVQVMADHQHVEVLIHRVDGIGQRRIGG